MISKLLAGRAKDLEFASALIRDRLVDPAVLLDRVALLDDDVRLAAVERVVGWLKQFDHLSPSP